MPQLAFATGFWEEYEQLEKPVRAGVRKAMAKFQQLTVPGLHADKGLHLESVEHARDPRMRTIRITDFWRGVVLAPDDGGQTFLLVNVVPHDKAYEWAAKRLYTVNSATHGLEVRNVVAIEQLTPLLEQAAAQEPSRLFGEHSDTALRHLGIDDGLLPAVRTITDKPQLEAFARLFPEDQFEVLQYLAEGFGTDDVWRDVVAVRRPASPGQLDPRDLDTAIANTPNRITLVSGPAELDDILRKPFAAWRVFLHPTQRRVAYRMSYGGPAQVTGGPGTGKTVVALHRVKHLLERTHSQLPSDDRSRILLTTYTTALATALRENLTHLLDDADLLARVDVTTVNAVAHRIVKEAKGKVPDLIDDAEERSRWRALRKKFDLPWTEQFLAQEYRHVVLAQDLRSVEEYVGCRRRGRGSSLPPAVRPRLWQATAEFERQLTAEGKRTHLQLCSQAADLSAPRYRHVVVDEAQDLHPVQWRVLRSVVAAGADDLFITGDPHQRIYDSRVSLGSLGIGVTGRSSRLRVNYRSTEEILTWSAALLERQKIDDLSGDGADTLAGYRSALHGTGPTARGFGSEQGEVEALLEQVRAWLDAGVRPSEIAVCSRFHTLGARVQARLSAEGIAAVLVKDAPSSDEPGVRIASMHAMKGLEFRCVAVLGVSAAAFPYPPAVTPVEVDRLQHDSDLLAERCLLFVACTRAREALSVSWNGTASTFLPSPTSRDLVEQRGPAQ
ncbi:UvrD-helicase domain-containing protein [Kitasatospora sp. NPDC096147]|uniref:UvrD-helicase domain-containing protein n=1 Tax=Kitasatospora sp. NPDC096147 TaxID=3364093 RepID=UPI0037FAB2F3